MVTLNGPGACCFKKALSWAVRRPRWRSLPPTTWASLPSTPAFGPCQAMAMRSATNPSTAPPPPPHFPLRLPNPPHIPLHPPSPHPAPPRGGGGGGGGGGEQKNGLG